MKNKLHNVIEILRQSFGQWSYFPQYFSFCDRQTLRHSGSGAGQSLLLVFDTAVDTALTTILMCAALIWICARWARARALASICNKKRMWCVVLRVVYVSSRWLADSMYENSYRIHISRKGYRAPMTLMGRSPFTPKSINLFIVLLFIFLFILIWSFCIISVDRS